MQKLLSYDRNLFESTLYLWRCKQYTGPNGLQAANYLTDSLKSNGIEMFRFKTGTPARIDKIRSIFEDGRAVWR